MKEHSAVLFSVMPEFQGNEKGHPYALRNAADGDTLFVANFNHLRHQIMAMFGGEEEATLNLALPRQHEIPFDKEVAEPFPENLEGELYARLDQPVGMIRIHIIDPHK